MSAPFPVVYQPDLVGSMLSTQLGQDTGAPVITAYYRATGAVLQQVEDAQFDFLTGMLFEQATGAALDWWGAVVNQPRLGMPDSDYRRMIGAKILVDTCNGTPDAVRKIVVAIAETEAVWTVTLSGGLYAVCYEFDSMTPKFRRAILRAMDAVRIMG